MAKMIETQKAIGRLLLLGLTLTAGAAFGQVTGTILGTVADDQGLVLPGGTVTVTSDQLPGGPAVGSDECLGAISVPEPAARRLHTQRGALRLRHLPRGGDGRPGGRHYGAGGSTRARHSLRGP